MVGQHHRLNEHEFEQSPGDGVEQRSVACCSPQGRKDQEMIQQLNYKGQPSILHTQIFDIALIDLSIEQVLPGPLLCDAFIHVHYQQCLKATVNIFTQKTVRRNRLIDREQPCSCQGVVGRGGIDRECGINRCKLLPIEWINCYLLLLLFSH